ADRLSDGADRRLDQSGRAVPGRLSARPRRARPVRGAGLHGGRFRAVNGPFAFSPEELTAIMLSLRVAFWAMLGSLPVGVAVALLLSRGQFWGKSLLNVIVHLPLVIPPVVTGYILLLLFGRRGLLGEFFAYRLGLVFAFRWTGAALACAVMGFPLLVRSIRLSLDAIDRRLEDAAGTLGAN